MSADEFLRPMADIPFPLLITLMASLDESTLAACRQTTGGCPLDAIVQAEGWQHTADNRAAAIRPALTINAPRGKSPPVQAASVALLLVALEHWMAARTVGVPDLSRHLHQCSPFKELSALAASDSVGR